MDNVGTGVTIKLTPEEKRLRDIQKATKELNDLLKELRQKYDLE